MKVGMGAQDYNIYSMSPAITCSTNLALASSRVTTMQHKARMPLPVAASAAKLDSHVSNKINIRAAETYLLVYMPGLHPRTTT